jgi:ATP-dependent Clp protease ATP-binding subunit ClpC
MNHADTRFRPLPTLVRWFFVDRPGRIFRGSIRYASAMLESFSVVFLLKTLFSPWKNIVEDGKRRTFGQMFEAWSLNMLSRAVGAVVRLTAVFAACAFAILSIVIGLAFLGAWFLLPLTVIAIPWYVRMFRIDVLDTVILSEAPVDLLAAAFRRGRTAESLTVRDILAVALTSPQSLFLIGELELDRASVSSAVDGMTGTVDRDVLLAHADEVRANFKDERIEPVHVLVAFFGTPAGAALLAAADTDANDLWQVALRERMYEHWRTKPKSWSPEAIAEGDMFGQSWSRGYTDELDALTMEVRADRWKANDATILHRDAVDAAVHTLRGSVRDNVLIAAPIGSGRTMLVKHIVSAVHDAERSNHERFTRFLRLRTDILLSGVANPDAFLLQALARAKRERISFVIPDLGLLLKATDPKLRLVLQRCLESPNISVIGIVDPNELHDAVEKDPSMNQAFEKILLNASDDAEVMGVLAIESFRWEDSGVVISYKALKAVIELCRRFLPQAGFPAVAIEVLDDAARTALRRGAKTVSTEDVRTVVSQKSRVDVTKFNASAAPKLLALEETMTKRIVGQRGGIRVLCDALKRASADVRTRPRPLGTFLFLGPTGVGKTRTAQVLAEEYFGSADAMIRLDMNECGTEESIKDIIGGGDSTSALARRVQERPFSVVLLDEIEKAHPKVLNLFLQVLDEGQLRAADGTVTDFRNTIIIATSNAGALYLRDRIAKEDISDERAFTHDLVDHVLREKIFTPEFVNRFDAAVAFRPLTGDDAVQIAKLMVAEVVQSVREGKGIEVEVADDAVAALLEHGYSPEFGARELRRVVSDVIENHLADRFLREAPKRGDRVTIKREDLRL